MERRARGGEGGEGEESRYCSLNGRVLQSSKRGIIDDILEWGEVERVDENGGYLLPQKVYRGDGGKVES